MFGNSVWIAFTEYMVYFDKYISCFQLGCGRFSPTEIQVYVENFEEVSQRK